MTIRDNLLPVFFVCAPALLAQPQAGSDPGTVLRVVDLFYNPGEPRVSFGVVNISVKPVLAYSLKYTARFPDGRTDTFDVTQDYTSTLDFADRVVGLPPGEHVGEIKSGARVNMSFSVPQRDQVPELTVVPQLVVFSDNSVIGNNEEVAARIFQERQASRDEYAGYMAAIREALASSNVEESLRRLASVVDRAAKNKNVQGRHSSSSQPGFCRECPQFKLDIQGVLKRLGAGRLPREQVLSSYIQDVEGRHAAFASHADRAGARNVQ